MNTAGTVLVVDDEPNVRLVFRTALETAGYAVDEAEGVGSAWGAVRAGTVRLVLLDLRLAGDDGLDLLRRLRDANDDTPVVIVTAHGDVPNAVEAMKLGAVDFLAKPLSPGTLRAVVANVLGRKAPRAAVTAPVSAASQFRLHLEGAKAALNRREFAEADVLLKMAVALDDRSAEAHNLAGVLHELRNEHDAAYRSYRAALKADRHYGPAQHNMTRYYERFTFGRSAEPVDLGGR